MPTELNFNQGMAQLVEQHRTHKPAKQPEASNAAPAAAWRKAVDAQAADIRGGEATPEPFHTPKGTESAHQAWLRVVNSAV